MIKSKSKQVYDNISNDWKEVTLGDVVQLITKGTTPTTIGLSFEQEGVNFIKSESLNYNGNIDESKFVKISAETHERLKRSQIQKDDILLSMAGAYLGKSALVEERILPANTNQAVAIIRPNKSVVCPMFLSLFLRSKKVLNYINSIPGQSAQPNINFQELRSIPVVLPNLDRQFKIAKILSDLDAKIELNQQMNKTLETMAQAVFKHWFVDLEFPGHEKAKFMNGLSEGWSQGSLGDIATIESGKRPGEKSEFKKDVFTVPLIGASSVMGFVRDALFKEPILIIGRVGTHGIVQRVSWPAFPSDNTLVIRSKYFEYVYQVLRMIDYKSLNVGTTQPLITQTTMKKYSIVIPSNLVLEKFEVFVSELFGKIVVNNQEIESLMGIRDSLLPRLISGEIKVGGI